MKTIIETNSYPTRVILVPETDADRIVMQDLKFSFCEDKDSETVVEYEDPDDVMDFGQGVLVFSSYCNLT